jgi:hypothetical protein
MSGVVAAAAALHLAFGIAPVPCNAAPGSYIASVYTSGGDGTAITLQITGDTADFALDGMDLVVGKSGISPRHCGTNQAVSITATQK